jgi:hypothetical protein
VIAEQVAPVFTPEDVPRARSAADSSS